MHLVEIEAIYSAKKLKECGAVKKDYDKYVSPQNNPNIKLKRFLHLLSNGWLVINLLVFAVLLPDIRVWTLCLAAVFAGYAIILLFDKRKSEWAWWSIVTGTIISIAVSAGYVIVFELYFYLAVICAQIVVSAVLLHIFNRK